MSTTSPVLRLHPADNVVIARSQLRAGTYVESLGLTIKQDVPAAHKVAVVDLSVGEKILRYGQVIGVASQAIQQGDHVHTHNLSMALFERDYAVSQDFRPVEPASSPRTFMGIRRSDGRVATRNYIGLLSTVNCSATVVKGISSSLEQSGILADFPNVDGIVPLTHSFGCCIDHEGEGLEQLRRTLAGYLAHENFAGVVVVSLGCEANQLKRLFESDRIGSDNQLTALVMQELGGTRKTIEAGVAAVRDMLPRANRVRRAPAPLSHLKVALQCGGSDGYSGITANPALGLAVDKLVAHGGTAILSETPEIYGAEHLLTRRAASPEVAEKILERIRWWEAYAERENGSLDNNPTPGNKSGGLTTILEKSLGAVAKSGSTPLTGVYRYGELIVERGLVFMDAPGYDPMGATGQIASGANLVAFTTGRGSCFGSKPAPSIKIATNTAMFARMQDDMDVNCGAVMDGTSTLEEKSEEIFELLIEVASGTQSKSEQLGVGDDEFVPWMIGAQM